MLDLVEQVSNALSDTTRCKMLEYAIRTNHPVSTGMFIALTSKPSAAIGYHLRLLTAAELFTCTKVGAIKVYSVNRSTIEVYVRELNKLLNTHLSLEHSYADSSRNA
jgi:hypothetical protein